MKLTVERRIITVKTDRELYLELGIFLNNAKTSIQELKRRGWCVYFEVPRDRESFSRDIRLEDFLSMQVSAKKYITEELK